MSIPEIYKVQLKESEDTASVQRALRYVHQQAPNVTYTDVEPTADKVPFGGIVIHDDGTNRRIYLNTGKGKVGYISFTATI